MERLNFWVFLGIVGVLIDEYIKEGYLLKFSDILAPFITHEQILVVLVTVFTGITVWRQKQRKKKTEN